MNKEQEYLTEKIEMANGDKATLLFEMKVVMQEDNPASRVILAKGELDPLSLLALFDGLLAGVPTVLATGAFNKAMEAHSRKRALMENYERPGTFH